MEKTNDTFLQIASFANQINQQAKEKLAKQAKQLPKDDFAPMVRPKNYAKDQLY